jgi:Skp family chaperone for outer membrane proteins
VKKTHLFAAGAAGLLSLMFLVPVFSQNPARPTAGPRLALLDVSHIFKNHLRFKAYMDEMKADVERAEAQVKQQDEAIQKMVENLQGYKVGSQDYKALEEEIANRRAKLAIAVQMQRKDFLQREARIYHNVYREIEQELNAFCQSNAIAMVLRFNGEPVDVDKPDSVMVWINRPVVWYNQGLDITQYILDALNRRNPPPAGSNIGRPPAGPNVPFKR